MVSLVFLASDMHGSFNANPCNACKKDRDFFDVYSMVNEIGKGGYGVVYRCVHKTTAVQYAVKWVDTETFTKDDMEYLDMEERINRMLDHRNIVRFYQSVHRPNCRYLIMELLTGGELFENISRRDYYSEWDACRYMQQILSAVAYCHDHNIIHRDLRPNNFMLSSNEQGAEVKLIDFGVSVETHGRERHSYGFIGNISYAAPEMIREQDYGKPVDIWACGLILYRLLVGVHPFPSRGSTIHEILLEYGKFPSPEWDEVSHDARDLISQMLDDRHIFRITAHEACEHKFIKQTSLSTSHAHRRKMIDRMKALNAKLKPVSLSRVKNIQRDAYTIDPHCDRDSSIEVPKSQMSR